MMMGITIACTGAGLASGFGWWAFPSRPGDAGRSPTQKIALSRYTVSRHPVKLERLSHSHTERQLLMPNGYRLASYVVLGVGLIVSTLGIALLLVSLASNTYAFGWDILASALGSTLVLTSGFILTVGHFVNRERSNRH
ncbi:hypothetical protein Pla22_52240 [Rubripirellula amarantea]|uniref:Uncharacterized protein n=1 Tax=Rubripirellula amarantea TaxID=2527999 RepID=A0A5C5WAR3_9BACT|nr:hypothetical protein Pla22_52240 [Rubripirellula amarantea]